MKITCRINCIPKAQKRARSRAIPKNGKWIATTYKDSGQRQQEATLESLLMPYAPEIPFQGPLRLSLNIFLPIPKSKPVKWKRAAEYGGIRPTTKPDISNVVKHLEDVMNGTFFADDRQIVTLVVRKFYAEIPGYYLELEEI